MVVVTGATGHLGNVLCRELLARGKKVRAFVLPGDDVTPLADLDVEVVYGDILDMSDLIKAFEGAEWVFHLAALVSIEPGKKKILHKVNVTGTQNVITACREAGVGRLIYTSSIHALVEPPAGELIDETAEWDVEGTMGEYNKTKALASVAVRQATRNGLDAVIVCPTGAIGPYDYKRSQMASLFIDFVNRKLKAYINGAYDYVDVRDVAEGMVLAAEKGKKGEVYILSGEKLTVDDILDKLHEETDVMSPQARLPLWFAKLTAPLAWLYYKIIRTEPLYTPYSVRTLQSNCDISHKKASKELGYKPRPVRESIEDAVYWLKEQGMVKY